MGIGPYRTPGVAGTTMYDSHVKCDLIMCENTYFAYFSRHVGKYSTRSTNKM